MLTLFLFRLSCAQDDTIGDIPFKQDDVYSYGFLGRIILVTIICLVLAVVVVWLLRHFLYRGVIGPTGSGDIIRLTDHRRITPKMSVYVLEIDRQRVAIIQFGNSLVHFPLERSND